MMQCANEQCDVEFERKFGFRAQGKWYCKAHANGKEVTDVVWSEDAAEKESFLD